MDSISTDLLWLGETFLRWTE